MRLSRLAPMVGLSAPIGRAVAVGPLVAALAALPAAPAAAKDSSKRKALQCGDVVKRDVRLTADLVNCPGNGLVVGRRGVVIDLNGHTIDGILPSDGIGNGIDNSRGFDRVEVLNGTITNFKNGVLLSHAARNRLSRLTINRNRQGMLISASERTIVEDGGVSDNSASMRVGIGIALRSDSHDTQLTRMVMDNNEADGLSVFDSDRVRVVASSITNNYGGGMRLVRSADSFLLDSTLTNAGGGIEARETRNTVVRGNTISAHLATGIALIGSQAGRVQDNTILHASGYGIGVRGDRNLVAANRVLSSYDSAIALEGGNANAVQANQARALDNGILVAAGVTNAYVAGNLTNGSGDDGIEVRTPSAVLTGNTANDNGDYGIQAVPGVTDGGGNRASGNGNPEQCLGVSCTSP